MGAIGVFGNVEEVEIAVFNAEGIEKGGLEIRAADIGRGGDPGGIVLHAAIGCGGYDVGGGAKEGGNVLGGKGGVIQLLSGAGDLTVGESGHPQVNAAIAHHGKGTVLLIGQGLLYVAGHGGGNGILLPVGGNGEFQAGHIVRVDPVDNGGVGGKQQHQSQRRCQSQSK